VCRPVDQVVVPEHSRRLPIAMADGMVGLLVAVPLDSRHGPADRPGVADNVPLPTREATRLPEDPLPAERPRLSEVAVGEGRGELDKRPEQSFVPIGSAI